MTSRAERIDRFHQLHESGCFVIPNPWDAGSARALETLGFKAIATTSAGLAWSMGAGTSGVTLDEVLAHLRLMVDAVDVPVSADFEGGYAVAPEVAGNVRLAIDTGIAGLSIEDASGDSADPLLAFDLAVERIAAARRVIDDSSSRVLLCARSEGFMVGRPDIAETILRLTAYADAGAECLYAPGIRNQDDVKAVVTAVAPRAVNVVVANHFANVAELASLGVRRISVGGALARSAWTGFLAAAREIAEGDDFTTLNRSVTFADVYAAMEGPER